MSHRLKEIKKLALTEHHRFWKWVKERWKEDHRLADAGGRKSQGFLRYYFWDHGDSLAEEWLTANGHGSSTDKAADTEENGGALVGTSSGDMSQSPEKRALARFASSMARSSHCNDDGNTGSRTATTDDGKMSRIKNKEEKDDNSKSRA
jgi:hypothetical protein